MCLALSLMPFFDARYFHRDMFEIFSDRCSDRILFPAVSEFLLVSLFVSPQLEILTNLNHNSIYEYHEVIYLLVGSLYFIPHHCNSTLSFGIPIDVYLFNVSVKISCFPPFFWHFGVSFRKETHPSPQPLQLWSFH